MYWSLVLPFQITTIVLLAFISIATIAAPLVKWKRKKTFFWVLGLSLLAFVPSCTVIMNLIDMQRFGVFNYQKFEDVKDFRVERYLPSAARDITIHKHEAGFRARFTISQEDLNDYIDEAWNKYGENSVLKRDKMSVITLVDKESHELRYGDLGWFFLDDMIEIQGPTAGHGAGFSLWYSPSTRVAYQRGGYW